MTTLTFERLKQVLHYNPATGIFTWLVAPNGRIKIGMEAGVFEDGYTRIKIDRKSYRAHRLAWLYVHGVHPTGEVDHKDTVRNHNWIDNLRDVSRPLNMQNMQKARKNSTTGFLGVKVNGRRFQAKICFEGKSRCLGNFKTPELAHDAYLTAKRELHPGCLI